MQTSSKALSVYAPAPEKIEVDVASIKIIGKAVMGDLYNTNADFKRLATSTPGDYVVNGAVDEWTGAQTFAAHCRDVVQGPAMQIALLPPNELLELYRWLRKKLKISPATRRAIARKQMQAAAE